MLLHAVTLCLERCGQSTHGSTMATSLNTIETISLVLLNLHVHTLC